MLPANALLLAAVAACALLMALVELGVRARRWPRVAGWWSRALLLNAGQAAVAWTAGLTWERWLGAYRPWSAEGLGLPAQVALGYVAITFVYYWWHRWRHEVPLLWRCVHQVHHSPARIEILTSFYKHPLECLLNSLLSAAILVLVVGVGREAAAWAVALTGLAELFYHWNVRTPRWLGFLVQRPESHCVHHQRGQHAGNYADLPVWDMLFGTFRNPRDWEGQCGFGEAQELRLKEMLRWKEVA
jgi:sterol desaturase/sphingolipid hydroxylase (fatty acid hydroxylase superfamily)